MQDILLEDLAILLVEPSATQRKIITQQLEDEGVEQIEQAEDIASAMQVMTVYQPDLVISALYLEDGTAMDIVQNMANSEQLIEIPFILVSSEYRKEQLEQFRQSGVVAILPKPFEKVQLSKALKATIDLHSSEEIELDMLDIDSVRVLLVDDSAMARKFIKRVLEGLGFQYFTEAENGLEAAKILQDETFDLVVTDFNMPEMDGKQLSRYIREHSEQSHLPILMVSSQAEESTLSNIEQSGVNALCNKPFEPEHIKGVLHNLLNQ